MSFSLKFLFALTALAAILVANLIYPTSLGAFAAVNLFVVGVVALVLSHQEREP